MDTLCLNVLYELKHCIIKPIFVQVWPTPTQGHRVQDRARVKLPATLHGKVHQVSAPVTVCGFCGELWLFLNNQVIFSYFYCGISGLEVSRGTGVEVVHHPTQLYKEKFFFVSKGP